MLMFTELLRTENSNISEKSGEMFKDFFVCALSTVPICCTLQLNVAAKGLKYGTESKFYSETQ
jgi:hypothetical protein